MLWLLVVIIPVGVLTTIYIEVITQIVGIAKRNISQLIESEDAHFYSYKHCMTGILVQKYTLTPCVVV